MFAVGRDYLGETVCNHVFRYNLCHIVMKFRDVALSKERLHFHMSGSTAAALLLQDSNGNCAGYPDDVPRFSSVSTENNRLLHKHPLREQPCSLKSCIQTGNKF